MLGNDTVTFWRWLTGQATPRSSVSSAKTSAEERRVWLRHAACLSVRCGEAGSGEEPAVEAVICDISRGGVQITASHRFDPGTLLSVELPSTAGEDQMAVLAYVVRAQPHGESEWKMGCRFSYELNEQQLNAFGAARTRPSEPDPRGWERFPCDTKALYQRVNGPPEPYFNARVLNIAVGGMALMVQEPISVGDLLSTELQDAKGKQVVTILACVVHTQTIPEGQILGCSFLRELSETDITALA